METIVCGDCGAPDPEWASLNRGLLLCKECCSAHRTLGPQCSRIKSFKQSEWNSNLRRMILTLASGPANHVWEHTLMDPSKAESGQTFIKKPSPKDSLEQIKRKFVHAKHYRFQFVVRQKPETFQDRNQELHSTVRTSDLGTTLRLLASGADPNFFHAEKGTRPLHVAARSGQALQIELLYQHGAQTDAPDYLGQTAVEHALAAGFKDLAQRIVELRYHLTDQLSLFACNQVPDHSSSKHIIVPRVTSQNTNWSKQEQILHKQSDLVLEQLTADIYDEVDRRQLERGMTSDCPGSLFNKFSMAFLPVHAYFPSVRNQTRQKFARLTDEDLTALITLVLGECKQRHYSNFTNDYETYQDIFLLNEDKKPGIKSFVDTTPGNVQPLEDDDYPLYDSVASDDDLLLSDQQNILLQQRSGMEGLSNSSPNVKPLISSVDNHCDKEIILTTKLQESEKKIHELQQSNHVFKSEIAVLQKMVTTVVTENLELKKIVSVYQGSNSRSALGISTPILTNGHHSSPRILPEIVNKAKQARPLSLCDARAESSKTSESQDSKKLQLKSDPEIVQESTKKIVDSIKNLINFTNKCNSQGMLMTSESIYEEAFHMVSGLLSKDNLDSTKLNSELVLYQVLRLKSHIAVYVKNNTVPGSGDDESLQNMVQKVREICFDVGAAMKNLVAAVMEPHI